MLDQVPSETVKVDGDILISRLHSLFHQPGERLWSFLSSSRRLTVKNVRTIYRKIIQTAYKRTGSRQAEKSKLGFIHIVAAATTFFPPHAKYLVVVFIDFEPASTSHQKSSTFSSSLSMAVLAASDSGRTCLKKSPFKLGSVKEMSLPRSCSMQWQTQSWGEPSRKSKESNTALTVRRLTWRLQMTAPYWLTGMQRQRLKWHL